MEKIDLAGNKWAQAVSTPDTVPVACNCIGPQNGEPVCPCMMRSVRIVNGRYVRVERDLGPAPKAAIGEQT